jgi:hypothetical protein
VEPELFANYVFEDLEAKWANQKNIPFKGITAYILLAI